MSTKIVYVSPKGAAWNVKTSGARRAFRIATTQAEAIQIGRRIAMTNACELIVRRPAAGQTKAN